MMSREPVPMAQVYPPARSYSLAKLNQAMPRDYGQFEKVRVEKSANGDRRSHKLFEGLRRQQSYDADQIRAMYRNQSRHPEGFNSLQLLGANDDIRYLDKFMDTNRGRRHTREPVDNPKLKDTAKSNKSKSTNSNKSGKDKESVTVSGNDEILAFIGSLTSAASVDNIYESVEQIHYRKTVESMNRQEKVRSVQKTGHPLFDRLREERALAGGNDQETYTTLNSSHKRISRSAAPSRKISAHSSPVSSSNSSSDEQDQNSQRHRRVSVPAYLQQQAPSKQAHRKQHPVPTNPMRWGRPGSAGSESDEEWVIPRPKFINKRRDVRTSSTDESDSSTKSSPMR